VDNNPNVAESRESAVHRLATREPGDSSPFVISCAINPKKTGDDRRITELLADTLIGSVLR